MKNKKFYTEEEIINIYKTILDMLNEEQFKGSINYDVGCIKGAERIRKYLEELTRLKD